MPKFLHCADLHIDSPLRGLAAYEDAPVDEIRDATRRAFDNLVDLARAEQVGCVVIAGDVYDGERDDYRTALFLQRRFERLHDEGIGVALVYGNHDAASVITRRLRPSPNVHVFAHDHAETYPLEDLGLALHGRSYATREVSEDISQGYPAPVANLLNVGVLHTSLDGRPGHEPYAPCTAGGLAARGYQYWALGHVHQQEEIGLDGTKIVFPGNLQGRHARETGPKGATLVTYDGDRVVSTEHRVLDTVRWLRCEIDAGGAASVDEMLARVHETIAGQVADGGSRLHAVRVVIGGVTTAHQALHREREHWCNQLRGDAMGVGGNLWIEKIELRTTADGPGRDAAEVGEAVAAVRAAVAEARSDDAVLEELWAQLHPLANKLGGLREPLQELEAVDPSSKEQVRDVLGEVEDLLVSLLSGGDA